MRTTHALPIPRNSNLALSKREETTQMRLPQFTAEACLHQKKCLYRTNHAATYGLSTEVEGAIIRIGSISICSGDDDCNGMFSTGCGGPYARCWVRGPNDSSVFCMCSN